MTVIFLVNSQAAHRIASKICYLYDKIQTFLQGLTFKVKRFWFVFFFFLLILFEENTTTTSTWLAYL